MTVNIDSAIQKQNLAEEDSLLRNIYVFLKLAVVWHLEVKWFMYNFRLIVFLWSCVCVCACVLVCVEDWPLKFTINGDGPLKIAIANTKLNEKVNFESKFPHISWA